MTAGRDATPEHLLFVGADAEGNGVYLTCSCGWRHNGWDFPLASVVAEAVQAHLSPSAREPS